MKTRRYMTVAAAALACVFALAACTPEAHTHNYTEWKHSETEHWRICPEDEAEEEGSRAQHNFVGGKCECGYDEGHIHSYTAWKSSATEHWRICPEDEAEEPGTRAAHIFGDPVVERYPTLDAEGLEVRPCTVCGAHDPDYDGTMPKYTETSVIEYRYELVNSVGMPFGGKINLAIRVTDADGNKPTDGDGRPFNGNVVTTSGSLRLVAGAARGVYTMTVSVQGNSPDYTLLDTELSLTPASPNVKIRIKANPPETEPDLYQEGKVLKDYTFTSVKSDRSTVTLSDLYQDYRVVLISFFYVGCQYCEAELPPILEAYEEYRDEMAIVFLNINDDTIDTDAEILNWGQEFCISDFFIGRSTLFNKLTVTHSGGAAQVGGVPVSLFVDAEGSILKIHGGAIGHNSNGSFVSTVEDVYAVFDEVMAKTGWSR